MKTQPPSFHWSPARICIASCWARWARSRLVSPAGMPMVRWEASDFVSPRSGLVRILSVRQPWWRRPLTRRSRFRTRRFCAFPRSSNGSSGHVERRRPGDVNRAARVCVVPGSVVTLGREGLDHRAGGLHDDWIRRVKDLGRDRLQRKHRFVATEPLPAVSGSTLPIRMSPISAPSARTKPL